MGMKNVLSRLINGRYGRLKILSKEARSGRYLKILKIIIILKFTLKMSSKVFNRKCYSYLCDFILNDIDALIG